MKVAVWHNLVSGGAKRALYHHVRGLVERGHTLEAWCPPTADRDYLPLGELIKEHVVPLEAQPDSVDALIKRAPVFRDELKYEEMRLARALDQHCRACAEEINGGGFDLLFANPSIIHAVSSIGRYVETPKVLYLQEPNRPLYEARRGRLPWAALPSPGRVWRRPRYLCWALANAIGVQQLRLLAREEADNARAFDAVLVNSLFSRESVLRAYGLEAKVCYLGVDTDKFVDLRRVRENTVVGIGAFLQHKNVEFVIEALGQVPPPRPRLIWIGNVVWQPYFEEMKRLAQSLGVDFDLKTKIGDAEIVELLNRASVMAYAPRLEPFGFAPLEANACGTPVVAVAEGGVRETVVDGVNGLLVESDPKAMAAAIERLVSDRDYARRLGEQGARTVVEKWSWEAAVSRLEQRFQEALAARA